CDVVHRHRHQPVADDRTVSFHVVAGCFLAKHPSLPADRHAVSLANHPHVHRVVLLGVSRQGARGYRVSLSGAFARHCCGAPCHLAETTCSLAFRSSRFDGQLNQAYIAIPPQWGPSALLAAFLASKPASTKSPPGSRSEIPITPRPIGASQHPPFASNSILY